MHYFFKPPLAALLIILPHTGVNTLEFVIMLHYTYPESFICQHTMSPPRKTPAERLKERTCCFDFVLGFCREFFSCNWQAPYIPDNGEFTV